MMSFVGSVVSLFCGDVLGTYQGIVTKVDPQSQSITIEKAFRNGTQCKVPHVTISAQDIFDLKLLKTAPEASSLPEIKHNMHAAPLPASEHLEAKPAPAAPTRCSPRQRVSPTKGHSDSPGRPGRSPNGVQQRTGRQNGEGAVVNGHGPQRKRADSGCEQYQQVRGGVVGGRTSTPQKAYPRCNGTASRKQTGTKGETFAVTPVDDSFSGDFDFEKNLALFDKHAVFEEIENSGYPTVSAAEHNRKQPAKYGCHENVLQSSPVQYRQIKVKAAGTGREYVTDSGLVVPCISYELRQKLLQAAEGSGLSQARQMEMVGRSATEMVLQLCGGSHRLNPRNAHQRPSVVVLAGAHIQGAQAVNCARQLATHNVRVSVYLPSKLQLPRLMEDELALLGYTDAKVMHNIADLPVSPVDLLITAIECHSQPHITSLPYFSAITQWAKGIRAPVLAMDPPPPSSSPSSSPSTITAKWQLAIALPLDQEPLQATTQLYLADLGIPRKVYKQVGIDYVSPFEHKFVIPLHPNHDA